jgi:spermidine synthase
VALVLVLIGFTAVGAQVVLLRELLVVFSGNETSLGVALACWLIWTAAGSALAGRRGLGPAGARRLVAALEILAALGLPLSIVAVRAARAAFGALPGEVLGPGTMLLASWAGLSFFCLVSGGLFAAGSRLWSLLRGVPTADATGAVYLLEAAGSGLGGALASFVVLERLDAIQIALSLSFLNLVAAAFVLRRARWLPAAALLAFIPLSPWLERVSLARLWRGFELAETRNSVYGNLAVIRTEDSQTVYVNGLATFTVPDPAAAEEAVHYALLEHPHPTSLLLIGGGLNGSLAQALQHPSLGRIDYVELDPALLELAARRFPREWAAAAGDARVRLHRADGRLFLKTAAPVFDVIIVNLPDPRTAQLNRFYTLEFFREGARKLGPAGVLALSVTGSENYISEKQAAFLRSIRKTLEAVFPEMAAIPGSPIHLLACRQRGVLTTDARALAARLAERRLATSYVREYYLPFRMAADRVADLEAQIRPRPDTPLNRDFAPIACYLDAALWSARFPTWDRAFPYLAAGALVALGVFLVAGPTPGAAVAAMGFSQIGFEMILLLGFQAVYGYVYQQLAVVIAGFMAGLALGSWCGLRSSGSFRRRTLIRLQVLAALSGPALCALLGVSHLLYPVLALACGVLGGYQFIVASRLWGSPSTGALYALDLAGASAGAILFGAWLIPVFGFWRSAALIAAVSLAPVASVGFTRRRL